MGMGLMLAVGPLVAQGLGGNDDRLVRRAFRQGLFLAIAIGLVFTLPIATGRTVLIWLGQDPAILVHADEFLFWLAVGIPLSLFTLSRGNMSSRINGPSLKLSPLPWEWGQISSLIKFQSMASPHFQLWV